MKKAIRNFFLQIRSLFDENWQFYTMPCLVGFFAVYSIYVPDQAVSLAKSIFNATTPIRNESANTRFGFVPELSGIFSWLLCSSSLIICLWFVTGPNVEKKEDAKGKKFQFRNFGEIVPFAMAHLLILAPFILSTYFFLGLRFPAISIALTGVCIYFISFKYRSKHAWFTLALIPLPIFLHLQDIEFWPIAIAVSVPMLWCLLNYQTKKIQWLIPAALSLFPVIVSLFVSLSFKYNFYSLQPILNTAIVACWWVFPTALHFFLWNMERPDPEKIRKISTALSITMACIFFFTASLTTLYALNTLCLLACLALLSMRAMRNVPIVFFKSIVLIFGILMFYQAARLGPELTISDSRIAAVATPPDTSRMSDFRSFYHAWLAKRGETEKDNGPIILVALSGGGIRAATHGGLSLMSADETSGGIFGDRVLVVSAVSGGTLGTMAWLDGRDALLSPLRSKKSIEEEPYLLTRKIEGYFSNDFISPVFGSLVSHDLLQTFNPASDALPNRDSILANSWRTQWFNFLKSTGVENPDNNLFTKNLNTVYRDGAGPMVIFNATSVVDSRRAVYSNVSAKFDGALRMNSEIMTSDAALDSSRFAVISPIGESCSQDAVSGPIRSDFRVKCKNGTYPISIADGGYSDNSGLASVSNILDELEQYRPNLDNVFVISIRSNPEATLGYDEGTRFSNGGLLSQLVSPLFILDSSRSSLPNIYEQNIKKKLQNGTYISWDFSMKITYEMLKKLNVPKSKGMLSGYEDWERKREVKMRLSIPPLGWTLDTDSIHAIGVATTSYFPYHREPNCDLFEPTKTLCRSLLEAKNSAKQKAEMKNGRNMVKNY